MSTSATAPALDSTPAVRPEVLVRRIGDEAVVWSELRSVPALLDPVATVMLDVVDGVATTAELTDDVRAALGIDRYSAWSQVKRVLECFDDAGVLVSSVPDEAPLVEARPLLPEPDW